MVAAPLSMATRSEALTRWQTLGWPTTRDEAWRNFSLRALEGLALDAAPPVSAPAPADLAWLERGAALVFVDGHLLPTTRACPYLAPLRLDAIAPADGALEALNTAYLTGSLGLEIPPGVDAGHLIIVHIARQAGVTHLRHGIRLGAHAKLALSHLYLGDKTQDSSHFVNVVHEVELAAGAELLLGQTLDESAQGTHIGVTHARVGEGAKLQTFTVGLAGERVRSASYVTLAEPSAQATVDGLYLGRSREHMDHVTVIRHAAPDTRSDEHWAGVLDERAEGGFQGLVRIDAGAVRSETHQLTRTLLLSRDAEAHAKPELHIDCDDVVATHGATIGQLAETELFYLLSRGIPPDLARRMLIQAFIRKAQAAAPAVLREGPLGFDAAIAQALGLTEDVLADAGGEEPA